MGETLSCWTEFGTEPSVLVPILDERRKSERHSLEAQPENVLDTFNKGRSSMRNGHVKKRSISGHRFIVARSKLACEDGFRILE